MCMEDVRISGSARCEIKTVKISPAGYAALPPNPRRIALSASTDGSIAVYAGRPGEVAVLLAKQVDPDGDAATVTLTYHDHPGTLQGPLYVTGAAIGFDVPVAEVTLGDPFDARYQER